MKRLKDYLFLSLLGLGGAASAEATAGHYNDAGDLATATFNGMMSFSSPLSIGSALQLDSLVFQSGDEEFAGIIALNSKFSGALPLSLTVAGGGVNSGLQFDFDYNRDGVSDIADAGVVPPNLASGGETGTFSIDIDQTLVASVTSFMGLTSVMVGGSMSLGDGAGYYQDGIQGSWMLSSSFTNELSEADYTLIINASPELIVPEAGTVMANLDFATTVPEPGTYALLGSVLGVAALRRRAVAAR